jgi:hypothetical protein
MKAGEAIDDLQKALDDLIAKNEKTVSIDALKNYLSLLRKDAENSNEIDRIQHEKVQSQFVDASQRNIAAYNAKISISLEMFKSVILAGQTALKSSMIINGGAAAALLAFIGHALSSPSFDTPIKGIVFSLFIFCAGVLVSAIAAGTTYFSQALYNNEKPILIKIGSFVNFITISLVLSSYALFGYASYVAYKVFSQVV